MDFRSSTFPDDGALIDYHGNVLINDHHGLRTCPLKDVSTDNIVYIDQCTSSLKWRDQIYSLQLDENKSRLCRYRGALDFHHDGPLLSLGSRGIWISSRPNHELQESAVRDAWERFFPVTLETLKFLLVISNYGFFSSNLQRAVGAHEISVKEFNINYHNNTIPLSDNSNFSLDESTNFLLSDRLSIDAVNHLNPAIYMCCFGLESLLLMANILISSAQWFSGVKFSFIIFTDLEEEFVRSHISVSISPSVSIICLAAFGKIEKYYARYTVTQHQMMKQFQPVIYCDVDVVCNANLELLVEAMLLGHGIYCNFEEHGSAWSVGWFISDFPSRDQYLEPLSVRALNSGVFGYRNYQTVADAVRVIDKISRQISRHHGIGYLALDQGVMNYCLLKLSMINDKILAGKVINRPVGDFIDIPRIGFAHFCGENKSKYQNKESRMGAYFEFCKKHALI